MAIKIEADPDPTAFGHIGGGTGQPELVRLAIPSKVQGVQGIVPAQARPDGPGGFVLKSAKKTEKSVVVVSPSPLWSQSRSFGESVNESKNTVKSVVVVWLSLL